MKGIWFDNIHSYENLNLILSSVSIPPATVKTNYIDIPGADGSIDLTEALGMVRYKNRECSFVFSVFPYEDFEEKKKEVSNLLNGKKCKIKLDKDAEYFWIGRCSVNTYASDKNLHKITVKATVEPYKLKCAETVVDVELSSDDCRSNVFGNPICIDDISPVEHTLGLKIGGMTRKCTNLIPFPYADGGVGAVKESNGITWKVNADGSITAKGTATALSYFILSRSVDFGSEKVNAVLETASGNGKTFSGGGMFWNAENNTLSLELGTYAEDVNKTFYPMINEGSSALPYEPYFEGLRSAPVSEVESVGVNLIPYPYIDTTKTVNGVTFTVNNDGSIGVKGTATANAVFYLVANKKINALVSGITYIPSTATSTTKTILMCNYIDTDGTTKNFTTSLKGAMQYPSNVKSDVIYLLVQNGTTVDETVYPMLNKGTTALPYTPFTRNTLPIPVAVQVLDGYGEGINENVYNYIDYEKKQFIKHVGKVDMGTIDWVYTNPFGTGVMCFKATAPNNAKLVGANDTSNVLCALFNTITANRMSRGDEGITTFATLNGIFINDSTYTDAATFSSAMSGVMLYYELAEPAVTDISSMMTAEGLKSFYPVTNLSTNEGAVLDVAYLNEEHTPKDIVLNNARKPVVPIVECSDDNTTIEFGDVSVTVNAGKHKILDLQLKEGENPISITGFGAAKISYQEGDL